MHRQDHNNTLSTTNIAVITDTINRQIDGRSVHVVLVSRPAEEVITTPLEWWPTNTTIVK